MKQDFKLIMENWKQFINERMQHVSVEEQERVATLLKEGWTTALLEKINQLKKEGTIPNSIVAEEVIKVDMGKSKTHKSKDGKPHMYVTVLFHEKLPRRARSTMRMDVEDNWYIPEIQQKMFDGTIPEIIMETFSGFSYESARNFGYPDGWMVVKNYSIRFQNRYRGQFN